MTKSYASTLGFGLVGLVFLVVFFDSRRLYLIGQDPMAVLNGSAIYALAAAFFFGYTARLIFSASLPYFARQIIRSIISLIMTIVIAGTLFGCGLLVSGLKYELFAKVFLLFSIFSSVSASLWLARFNRPVSP